MTPARQQRRQATRGFSLVEVLVVVVILGILAVVVVPKIMDRPDEARAVRAAQDIAAIESALALYRLDNNTYPDAGAGLSALVTRPAAAPRWREGGYLARLPRDPWQADYQYRIPGEHGEVDVWTWGADGRPGGDGANRDVGNW